MRTSDHHTTGACLRASTPATDARSAAAALREQFGPGPFALVMAFAAPTVDRDAFAAALHDTFAGTPAVGCTTAGELGTDGFAVDSVAAFALAAPVFRTAHCLFPDVRMLGPAETQERVTGLLEQLTEDGTPPTPDDTFAVLLIDGMSAAEELAAIWLSAALGGIALVGGSAADGLQFGTTHVFADGAAHAHGAVLVLVRSSVPFAVFKTQHLVPGEHRIVVTAADSARRNVSGLDGLPAAAEFARRLGVDLEDLTPETFATNPVVVRIGGADYVRAIQKREADGSLTFFCAVDRGIVLRMARGVGMVQNLSAALGRVRDRIGEPALTIAFDCILRRLELQRRGRADEVSALLRANRCIGFSTYGEQFHGMHVNQTLTGVAIAAGPQP